MTPEEIHAELDRLSRAQPYAVLADKAAKLCDAMANLRNMAQAREDHELNSALEAERSDAAERREKQEAASRVLRHYAETLAGLCDGVIVALRRVDEGAIPTPNGEVRS